MTSEERAELAHLWDGSENWGLSVFHETRVTMFVVFGQAQPGVRELRALREAVEEFRRVPVSELKNLIGATGEMQLGPFSGMKAREVELRLQRAGCAFRSEAVDLTSYLPVSLDEERHILLIEDDALAKEVEREMLKAGVPIVGHIECD